MLFPYSTLTLAFSAVSTWVRGELIGRGTHTCVYLALHVATGVIFAVKQVKMPPTSKDINDQGQVDTAHAPKQEYETVKGLHHPNIVQYLGLEETSTFLSMCISPIVVITTITDDLWLEQFLGICSR